MGAAEYTDDRPGRKRLFYSRGRKSHRGTADLEIGSSGDLDAELKKSDPNDPMTRSPDGQIPHAR